MRSSTRLSVAICIMLAVLVGAPSILFAHATTVYVPNVMSGEFAQYRVLKDTCQSSIPQVCQALKISLNDTTYAAIQVVGVSGTSVTLQLISIYKNGTGAQEGALVDVATGTSNVTAFGQLSGDYFVLATNLHYGDQLWSNPSPTFNTTSTEMVLGATRSVNFLNSSASGTSMGTTYTSTAGFAYDQSSGFLIEINTSIKISLASTELDFRLAMVDNNIWGMAHLPDFGLTPSPTIINIVGSASGVSTVSLTRLYGFDATVKLTATPSSSSISCSLSSSSLAIGSSDASTLSCAGSPGTYTVAINGNAGFAIHSASVAVNIAGVPDFTITNNGPIAFTTGASGMVTVTIASQYGYGSATNLEVTSTPTGLTCNLNNNSINGYGSVTLTCSGQPGTYTVTVKATGGGTSHSTQTTVTVNAAPAQPAISLPMPVVYGGIAVAAVVATLIALLFLRKKPSGAVVAPSDPSSPTTQA